MRSFLQSHTNLPRRFFFPFRTQPSAFANLTQDGMYLLCSQGRRRVSVLPYQVSICTSRSSLKFAQWKL